MGVLSELVIADETDAPRVAESDSPTREWDGIVWNTLDQIKLSSLWTILEGFAVDVNEVVRRVDHFRLLHEVSEHGPCVYAVPRKLRDLLAELSAKEPEELRGTIEAWAATDELQGWESSEVKELLQSLVDLSDTATLEDKGMLLWICL